MFIFETRCRSLQENARPILIHPFPVRYRIQTSYNLDELHDKRGSHVMSTNECRLQELLHSLYYLLRQNIQNISWILQTLSFSNKREVPIKSCNIVLKNLISNKKKSQAPNFTQYCPQELRLSQTRDKSPWKVVILSSRTLSTYLNSQTKARDKSPVSLNIVLSRLSVTTYIEPRDSSEE